MLYLHVSRIWIYYSNCSPSTEAAKVVATTAVFAIISPTYAHSEYYSRKWTSLACDYVKSIAFHSAATTLYIVVSMNSDWSNAAFEMRRSDIAKPTRWANSAFFVFSKVIDKKRMVWLKVWVSNNFFVKWRFNIMESTLCSLDWLKKAYIIYRCYSMNSNNKK